MESLSHIRSLSELAVPEEAVEANKRVDQFNSEQVRILKTSQFRAQGDLSSLGDAAKKSLTEKAGKLAIRDTGSLVSSENYVFLAHFKDAKPEERQKIIQVLSKADNSLPPKTIAAYRNLLKNIDEFLGKSKPLSDDELSLFINLPENQKKIQAFCREKLESIFGVKLEALAKRLVKIEGFDDRYVVLEAKKEEADSKASSVSLSSLVKVASSHQDEFVKRLGDKIEHLSNYDDIQALHIQLLEAKSVATSDDEKTKIDGLLEKIREKSKQILKDEPQPIVHLKLLLKGIEEYSKLLHDPSYKTSIEELQKKLKLMKFNLKQLESDTSATSETRQKMVELTVKIFAKINAVKRAMKTWTGNVAQKKAEKLTQFALKTEQARAEKMAMMLENQRKVYEQLGFDTHSQQQVEALAEHQAKSNIEANEDVARHAIFDEEIESFKLIILQAAESLNRVSTAEQAEAALNRFAEPMLMQFQELAERARIEGAEKTLNSLNALYEDSMSNALAAMKARTDLETKVAAHIKSLQQLFNEALSRSITESHIAAAQAAPADVLVQPQPQAKASDKKSISASAAGTSVSITINKAHETVQVSKVQAVPIEEEPIPEIIISPPSPEMLPRSERIGRLEPGGIVKARSIALELPESGPDGFVEPALVTPTSSESALSESFQIKPGAPLTVSRKTPGFDTSPARPMLQSSSGTSEAVSTQKVVAPKTFEKIDPPTSAKDLQMPIVSEPVKRRALKTDKSSVVELPSPASNIEAAKAIADQDVDMNGEVIFDEPEAAKLTSEAYEAHLEPQVELYLLQGNIPIGLKSVREKVSAALDSIVKKGDKATADELFKAARYALALNDLTSGALILKRYAKIGPIGTWSVAKKGKDPHKRILYWRDTTLYKLYNRVVDQDTGFSVLEDLKEGVKARIENDITNLQQRTKLLKRFEHISELEVKSGSTNLAERRLLRKLRYRLEGALNEDEISLLTSLNNDWKKVQGDKADIEFFMKQKPGIALDVIHELEKFNKARLETKRSTLTAAEWKLPVDGLDKETAQIGMASLAASWRHEAERMGWPKGFHDLNLLAEQFMEGGGLTQDFLSAQFEDNDAGLQLMQEYIYPYVLCLMRTKHAEGSKSAEFFNQPASVKDLIRPRESLSAQPADKVAHSARLIQTMHEKLKDGTLSAKQAEQHRRMLDPSGSPFHEDAGKGKSTAIPLFADLYPDIATEPSILHVTTDEAVPKDYEPADLDQLPVTRLPNTRPALLHVQASEFAIWLQRRNNETEEAHKARISGLRGRTRMVLDEYDHPDYLSVQRTLQQNGVDFFQMSATHNVTEVKTWLARMVKNEATDADKRALMAEHFPNRTDVQLDNLVQKLQQKADEAKALQETQWKRVEPIQIGGTSVAFSKAIELGRTANEKKSILVQLPDYESSKKLEEDFARALTTADPALTRPIALLYKTPTGAKYRIYKESGELEEGDYDKETVGKGIADENILTFCLYRATRAQDWDIHSQTRVAAQVIQHTKVPGSVEVYQELMRARVPEGVEAHMFCTSEMSVQNKEVFWEAAEAKQIEVDTEGIFVRDTGRYIGQIKKEIQEQLENVLGAENAALIRSKIDSFGITDKTVPTDAFNAVKLAIKEHYTGLGLSKGESVLVNSLPKGRALRDWLSAAIWSSKQGTKGQINLASLTEKYLKNRDIEYVPENKFQPQASAAISGTAIPVSLTAYVSGYAKTLEKKLQDVKKYQDLAAKAEKALASFSPQVIKLAERMK